jgi:DNA-binding MarR family transcriptional regulator
MSTTPTTSTTPTFNTAVLGQTEKALNAILDRQLTGTGLTESTWITLAVASAGTLDSGQLVGRVAGALKVGEAEAQAHVAKLVAAQLVEGPEGDGSPVKLTDVGQQLYGQIRTAVTQITQRMWGDLPAEDLETAGRVLSIILARANAEMGVA